MHGKSSLMLLLENSAKGHKGTQNSNLHLLHGMRFCGVNVTSSGRAMFVHSIPAYILRVSALCLLDFGLGFLCPSTGDRSCQCPHSFNCSLIKNNAMQCYH